MNAVTDGEQNERSAPSEALAQVLLVLRNIKRHVVQRPKLAMFFLRDLHGSVDSCSSIKQQIDQFEKGLREDLGALLVILVNRMEEIYRVGWSHTINYAEGKEAKFFFPDWDEYGPRRLFDPPDLVVFNRMLNELLADHGPSIEVMVAKLAIASESTTEQPDKARSENPVDGDSASRLDPTKSSDKQYLSNKEATLHVLKTAYEDLTRSPPSFDSVRVAIYREAERGRIRKHSCNPPLRYLKSDVDSYAIKKLEQTRQRVDE